MLGTVADRIKASCQLRMEKNVRIELETGASSAGTGWADRRSRTTARDVSPSCSTWYGPISV